MTFEEWYLTQIQKSGNQYPWGNDYEAAKAAWEEAYDEGFNEGVAENAPF